MDDPAMKQYFADSPPTMVKLEIEPHFSNLSEREKAYAHHMSRLVDMSRLLSFIDVPTYQANPLICGGDWKKLQEQTRVSSEDVDHFLSYAAQFLGNLGELKHWYLCVFDMMYPRSNYKGFGDSKFVPRISPSAFEQLVSKDVKARSFFESTGGKNGSIFATPDKPGLMHLGFIDQGHMSTYYPESPTITKQEIDIISEVMAKNDILPENTRLQKLQSGDFDLLIASGISNPPSSEIDSTDHQTSFPLPSPLDGKSLHLVFGDHREEMAKAALSIRKAGHYVANPTQAAMLDAYAKSFGTGSLKAFKTAQEHWVRDLKPTVESNIGFVETYRDPAGIRGEWEGFVATVNQERTLAFGRLVSAAPRLIPTLPWPKDFEKDTFKAPDFTSLEVLAFTSSGIPAGINIPNYDDIRQAVGFKNVSLGNVLGAKSPNEPVPFIDADDLDAYTKHRDAAFEVQVGIHELLGHGTGKILAETQPGAHNFDQNNPPLSPVTGQPISSWYRPGQTYSSVFGSLGSAYEECRAECVAMYLACDMSILKLFDLDAGAGLTHLAQHSSTMMTTTTTTTAETETETAKAKQDPYRGVDVRSQAFATLHAAYLSMARAGIAALEMWDPKSGKWGQAHSRARWGILQCFLDASSEEHATPFCAINPAPGGGTDAADEDLDALTVRIDPMQILTTGRRAVGEFLTRLHVYKTTADVEAGRELFERMTRVRGREHGEWWAEKVRAVVLRKRVPRK
ncbi:MAG: hypothetical protein LQ340_001106, partial [Diploschistes diacapsis]